MDRDSYQPHTTNEECKQPNWNSIIEKCKEKIELKFKEYSNSWVDNHLFNWQRRLQGEVNEVSKYSDFSQEDKIAELVDVINICAMMISNLQSLQHEEMRMSRYS